MPLKALVIDKKNLTEREGEVLSLICEGKPDKLIARQLAISIKTVSQHCENIYQKMAVREASINTRCAAIGKAVSNGMIRFHEAGMTDLLMERRLFTNRRSDFDRRSNC